ncbi:MAG: glycosyltransferase family 39 protein, partial [Ignavibacteria bacterium]|nr:glycosyltransferase family 39 protein [Ignavibacteria bacterium]
MKILIKENPWFLALIAIALYSLVSVCYNSVATAEAETLLSGKILFNELNFSTNSQIPSSPLAPIILGLGDALFGITGARIIAILFALISVVFFYELVRSFLKDTPSSFLSTIVFVSSSSFLFLGKTATFEIISLTFFIIFLYISQRKQELPETSHSVDILSAVFLFLAISTNFLLFVFVPFLIVGVLISSRRKRFYIPLIILVVLIVGFIFSFPTTISKFQLLFNNPKQEVPFIFRIISLFQYIIIPLILLTAMFTDRARYHHTNKIYYIFFGLAFLVFAVLLVNGDHSSGGRNITFAVLFLSPLTGVVLKDYLQRQGTTKMTVIVVLFAVFLLSFYKVRLLENSYPN